MGSYSTFVSVLTDLALKGPLDYAVPESSVKQIQRGMQVKVPVRGQLRAGYVIDIKEKSDVKNILPIHAIISESPLFTEEIFRLAVWMSSYYNTPLRQVLKSVVPGTIRQQFAHKEQFFVKRGCSKEKLREQCAALQEKHPSQARILEVLLMATSGLLLTELLEKTGVSKSPIESLQKKGLVQIERVRIDRSPLVGEEYFKTYPKTLNEAQAKTFLHIKQALQEKKFSTHLLYGITGSGKTEIYLQAIEEALTLEQSTIMLVPEIALTGQTIERFRSRFDDRIAILHHRLSHGERFDEWHRIRRGDAKIVIGARSALFSPVQNLGLVIVDEEHEGAYKQSEEQPCYHARDVAVVRGKFNDAVVILGSATPSLESYYNTQIGKYTLHHLPSRATKATLPKVHVVDMKKEFEKAGGFTLFSDQLINKVKNRLELGEQTILFLNRRGYHTSLQCKMCGHIFKCPSCDLSLTFHRSANTLSCHICDFSLSPSPSICSECKDGETLKYQGVGTEQVERAVHALFPEARTLRIDGDTTKHKGSHERLFRAFSTQKADILIGTQMVSKGLHFPAVTLVAVLNSDSGLHIPDFRASERVFGLITQVSGRAGRDELPGEVVIQTQMPENTTIKQAASQDYEAFYKTEIETRKIFSFPPYTHLVKLTFSGQDAGFTQKIAEDFTKALSKGLGSKFIVHPLTPSGYAKIKDFYRFQCLIRGTYIHPVNQIVKQLLDRYPLPAKLRLHIDVDPQSTFF